ncbi:MAG: SagB/ThcOx family dehydrogenase [Syntrophales bacterium]
MIGREFLEKTTYPYLGPSDQAKGVPQPPLQLVPDRDRQLLIDLPPPSQAPRLRLPLAAAIDRRASVRTYAAAPLTIAELSWLLWCTQGVKEVILRQATLRTVPSAGARHALETYLLVNRVAGLRAGLYRFVAIGHQLLEMDRPPEPGPLIREACLGQEMVTTSAVTFIWTAVIDRMTWRYGARGYRYVFLDAGHACQNLYLAAQDVGGGVCAVAAFDDGAMNRILGINPEEQFTLYLATLGKV